MTVDLDSDKQDYPQPSDLSTFVNETKFSSPTEGEQELGKKWGMQAGQDYKGNKCVLDFLSQVTVH